MSPPNQSQRHRRYVSEENKSPVEWDEEEVEAAESIKMIAVGDDTLLRKSKWRNPAKSVFVENEPFF